VPARSADDGLDYSQKGKSPFTRSVIRCLQDRSVVHYMDSWIRYCYVCVYKDAAKKSRFFTSIQSNDISKYCKKAVRREILSTIHRISLTRAHVNLLLNLICVIYIYSISSNIKVNGS